jgi:hypothetical protein
VSQAVAAADIEYAVGCKQFIQAPGKIRALVIRTDVGIDFGPAGVYNKEGIANISHR